MTPLRVRLISSIFILVGSVVLWFGTRSLVDAHASPGWPTAPGKVVTSRVDSSHSDGSTTYHAAIRYEYSLWGETHSSNKIAFGDYGSSNPSHAQGIVNRYPAGAAVAVHYSPKNPDLAVLEPGVQGQAFALPAFGAVFIFAGCFVFIKFP